MIAFEFILIVVFAAMFYSTVIVLQTKLRDIGRGKLAAILFATAISFSILGSVSIDRSTLHALYWFALFLIGSSTIVVMELREQRKRI